MRTRAEIKRRVYRRAIAVLALITIITAASSQMKADTGTCSGQSITLPFTDVASGNIFFCSIAEAFLMGLTNGTDATHYSPSANVPREQMAAFITRTLDASLHRGSRRAALGQFWNTQADGLQGITTVGDTPISVKSDGFNLWVANHNSDTVMRVSAANNDVTGTWTGVTSLPNDLVIAMSKAWVITEDGHLYRVDPNVAPGAAVLITSGLGTVCEAIAFDGARLWVTSKGSGSVSAIRISPLQVQTFTTDLIQPGGVLYDGANIWVTDLGDDSLKKLNSDGSVAFSVALPNTPGNPKHPVFDGTNIWVPTQNSKLYVVRRDGTLLATLAGNGLSQPFRVAFDGERILASSIVVASPTLSLWHATDFAPLGSVAVSNPAHGVCSDGISFWFTQDLGSSTPGKIVRF